METPISDLLYFIFFLNIEFSLLKLVENFILGSTGSIKLCFTVVKVILNSFIPVLVT